MTVETPVNARAEDGNNDKNTKPKVNSPINHSRYEVGNLIGEGTWGVVYEVMDNVTGERLAAKVLAPSELAKEQMKQRKLNPKKMMLSEGSFTAASRVVPRRLEVDRDGQYFIIMPIYNGGSLDKWIERFGKDWANPQVASEYLNLKIPGILRDIAEGLSEFHKNYKKAHSDLKLDNILIDDNGRASINDLGTATCASFGMRSISPRDNMGCIFTRAPECSEEGGHPTFASDVYSAAAVARKLYTGRYPLEDLIGEAGSLKVLVDKLGKKEVQKMLKKDMKDSRIPRKVQKVLMEATSLDPYRRPCDGTEFREKLEKSLQNQSFADSVKRFTRKFTLPILGVTAIAAFLGYQYSTYEPKELTMPKSPISGPVYLPRDPKEKIIEFDIEKDLDLPPARKFDNGIPLGMSAAIKRSTNNRVVAYLTQTFKDACWAEDRAYMIHPTEYQKKVYFANITPDEHGRANALSGDVWPVIGKNIEIALTLSRTKDEKVDLEDTCAISRLGIETVTEAKRVAGSENWREYQNAQHSDGRYVIDVKEKSLINRWISQIVNDPN